MKKYSIFDLFIVKQDRGNGTHQCFICKQDKKHEYYIEIFTKTKMEVNDDSLIEPFKNYFSPLTWYKLSHDNKLSDPLSFPLSRLLEEYNKINYLNYNLETDEETIIDFLNTRGLYESSKIYMKKRLK